MSGVVEDSQGSPSFRGLAAPDVGFPKGFVISTDTMVPPDGFVDGPLLRNFFVHPWCDVDVSKDWRGRFVVVIGTCVPVDGLSGGVSPSSDLLECLLRGEAQLLHRLDGYCGRYAVVYGGRRSLNVVTDATAMRSVFYAAGRGTIGSHALLVERTLPGNVVRNEMPFRYGYPGNRVPYARTRLLTANTLYDLSETRVRRFWPRRRPPEMSVDEAAEVSLRCATAALTGIARTRTVKLALTAGLDSRALLAVALESGVSFESYTYGIGNDTLVDRNVAADLARSFGFGHTIIATMTPPDSLARRLAEAHFAEHHQRAIPALMEWVGDPSAVAVTANLLEIGRSFYKRAKAAGVAPPTTARAMSALHYRVTPKKSKDQIRALGESEYLRISENAFEEFIADSQLESVLGILDPFDQFYWEHRMSAWHGASMVERDFYAEPFIPFNSRVVFEAMLGVDEEKRAEGAVLHRLIEMVDPRLLDLPVNPEAWPPRPNVPDC